MTRRRTLWRIKKRYGTAKRVDRSALEARVWRLTPADYKTHWHGKRAIMVMGPHGSTLKTLEEMTISELERYSR